MALPNDLPAALRSLPEAHASATLTPPEARLPGAATDLAGTPVNGKKPRFNHGLN